MLGSNSDHCLFLLPSNAVVTADGVYVLDLAAKIDATADYICKVKWGDVEFPPPFGREAYPEASARAVSPGLFLLLICCLVTEQVAPRLWGGGGGSRARAAYCAHPR